MGHFAMMGGNGIDDDWGFVMVLQEIGPDQCVGSFRLVTHGFSNVMKQTRAFRDHDVITQLCRH